MKAASRVQCYDNRDVYFFCLGAVRLRPALCACLPALPQGAAPRRLGRRGRSARSLRARCRLSAALWYPGAEFVARRAKRRGLPQVQTLGEEGACLCMRWSRWPHMSVA